MKVYLTDVIHNELLISLTFDFAFERNMPYNISLRDTGQIYDEECPIQIYNFYKTLMCVSKTRELIKLILLRKGLICNLCNLKNNKMIKNARMFKKYMKENNYKTRHEAIEGAILKRYTKEQLEDCFKLIGMTWDK